MANSTTLKIGIQAFGVFVTKCAEYLTILAPSRGCPDIGDHAKLLGNALSIDQIPYQLVPLDNAHDIGALDETTGEWNGT